MPDKHCYQCSKELPPHKFRYCGDECRDKYRGRERKSPINCKECGGDKPEGKRFYCSDHCHDEARRKRKKLYMRYRRAEGLE